MALDLKNIQDDINFVNTNIADAINELFRRVTSVENTKHEVLDEKVYPPISKGVLQDCEFGMILLYSRHWLNSQNALLGLIAEEKDVKTVAIEIFERTINRILVNNNRDYDALNSGGSFKDSPVFFTGEPYTYFTNRFGTTFSANLDAAMIILAFLSTTLVYCDKELNEKIIALNPKVKQRLPDWVNSLKDVGLFVIKEGLEYAQACRVYSENKFFGFTCDPTSKLNEKGEIWLDDYDRLFFTWTACETINDLVNWIEYVEKLENRKFAEELIGLITDLQSTIAIAGEWVYRSFYNDLVNFKSVNVKKIIDDIQNDEVDSETKIKIGEELKNYVQYVYHLSLYAAVRSLSPGIVLLQEIEKISTRINDLVLNDIIKTGLDLIPYTRDTAMIFASLSRNYSLGSSNDYFYADDAYYPLVVRSLSGLLTRTVSTFDKENWGRFLELVHTFKATLKVHVEDNLTKRRPKKEEDNKLWAVVKDQPFTLYATQRTIFALITYGDFLKKMKAVESSGVVSVDEAQKRLADKFAASIAKNLLGPEVLKELVEFSSSVLMEKSSKPTQKVPLPDPEWAQIIVLEWLSKFAEDFKKYQIEGFINQQAESLKSIWGYELPKKMKSEKKDKIADIFASIKLGIEDINREPLIGESLSEIYHSGIDQSKNWDTRKIVPLLFKYMFYQFITTGSKSIADMKNSSADLWGNIKSAVEFIKTINQINN